MGFTKPFAETKGDYQVIETVCRLLYMCEGKVLNRVRDQKLRFLIMSMSFSPDDDKNGSSFCVFEIRTVALTEK